MHTVQQQGLSASMDRLNSAEAAEWFANELFKSFGMNQPVSREHAVHLADVGGKYILGIMQKLSQLRPAGQSELRSGNQRTQRREASARSRSNSAKGGRFQSNADIFDEQTMDFYHREHGRL